MIVNGFLILDDAEIAIQFHRYFTSVAEHLVNNIPTTESHFQNYSSEPNVKSIFMKPTTPNEIQNIVSTIKPKLSCGIDNIPSKVIKCTPKSILKALSHVFNLSLGQGTFISSFKTDKVISLYKKGYSKIIQNYRPVSLRSCFSKILEKVVYFRLNNFPEKNNLFYNCQFGFRENHSTELAASDLVSKLTSAIESKELTMGIFLDLSKAFNCINHQILHSKLYHCGIRGIAHCWFSSYLSHRKQITHYGDQLPEACKIKHGVPQGSIFGPILFLIYVNDFNKCLNKSDAIMYADDTNIFLHHNHIDNLYTNAQIEMNLISNCLAANKLTLNVGKTKYLLFRPNKKNIPCYDRQLYFHLQSKTDVFFSKVE